MRARSVWTLASLALLSTTFSVSAQQPSTGAQLLRTERGATLNGQPVAADAAPIALGSVATVETKDGRAVIALKRGGTLVLGANTSARLAGNDPFNFNRIEILAGSAVLLSASNSGLVACGTEARLSSGGIFRFDVLEPERTDGSQRCRVRVYEGAASTPGATVTYVLRNGQEMVMNKRCGDMIPVMPLAAGALDDFDRWAREQAGR